MAFVEVRILDPSLRHLDRGFTYATDAAVDPGALVRVPFHGRLRNAVVVGDAEPFEGARAIKATLGPGLPPWMVEWAFEIADRTLSDVASVLAAMLPERVAAEERATPDAIGAVTALAEPAREAPHEVLEAVSRLDRVLVSIGAGDDAAAIVGALVRSRLPAGDGVLVVLPEADPSARIAVAAMAAAGASAAWLGSDASPRMRYRAWLRLRAGRARLAIGGRAAIFAPFEPSLVVVADEAHAAHKEGRAPRFHVRDLALMRAERHGARVALIGSPASIESRIDADPRRGRLGAVATPATIRPEVRIVEATGLSPGPATAQLLRGEPGRILVLAHRGEHVPVAAERLARVLERDVAQLDASSPIADRVAARSGDGAPIVVATAVVAEDHAIEGVGTLAILDAGAALASPGFRAAEEVVASWWRTLSAARPRRVIVESRERDHPAIDALRALDHDRFARAEAETRHATGYPPYRRFVRLRVATAELDRLLGALDGRSILGPMPDPNDETSRIVAVRGGERLVDEVRPAVLALRAGGVRVRADVDPWDLVEDRWRS